MPPLEEELRQAIAFRNEMAVELANSLLILASDDGGRQYPASLMITAFGADTDRTLANVQALTAVILNRAGMPWDAIAAHVECSKQALHRRLAARGERLFEEALSEFGGVQRTTDSEALIDALYETEEILDQGDYWEMLAAATATGSSVPPESARMVLRLATLPAPEYILTAGNQLAAVLVKLRKIRRWWWARREDLGIDQEAE
ncbi:MULTISPECIES: hypothetical protein [Mycobacterium]|uniref:Uncharacterized protein n=1 Tax=Mycobacterium intracellulare 1956 TaxID=1299331 RepID=X8CG82_MYCIT|nr:MULTISPECIES: hypothetical protein [Mycobacterium]EUA32001.1 hypothetical protein I548_0770 [Mycobacterium intracellulare]EUA55382.1 hypothetical protein I550_3537 [Mycobacterium intracellulare 1956]UQB90878.1 hypothetical protein KN252_16590 [Mycobacterium intracellulare]WSE48431.1 hypothetical protein QGN30_11345 [Mycobacterium sp. 3-98]